MLETLNKIDHELSKKIFRLDFKNPINYLIYATSVVYMEEAVIFSLLIFHYFIFENLKLSAYYLMIAVLNVILTIFMKRFFNRNRPSNKELSKSSKTHFFRKKQCNGSLPSGDTLQAFAFCAFTWYYCSQEIFIFTFVLALLIAFGRVYLCCHFIGDVAIGAFVGCFMSYFVIVWILEDKNFNWLWDFLD